MTLTLIMYAINSKFITKQMQFPFSIKIHIRKCPFYSRIMKAIIGIDRWKKTKSKLIDYDDDAIYYVWDKKDFRGDKNENLQRYIWLYRKKIKMNGITQRSEEKNQLLQTQCRQSSRLLWMSKSNKFIARFSSQNTKQRLKFLRFFYILYSVNNKYS